MAGGQEFSAEMRKRDALKLLEPGKHHFDWAGDILPMSLTTMDKDIKMFLREFKKTRKRSKPKPKPAAPKRGKASKAKK